MVSCDVRLILYTYALVLSYTFCICFCTTLHFELCAKLSRQYFIYARHDAQVFFLYTMPRFLLQYYAQVYSGILVQPTMPRCSLLTATLLRHILNHLYHAQELYCRHDAQDSLSVLYMNRILMTLVSVMNSAYESHTHIVFSVCIEWAKRYLVC